MKNIPRLINSIFIAIIFLLAVQISLVHSAPYEVVSILEFDAYNYRAGHFAVNSRGDMVIEYSRNNHRLFFGLKKDGNLFFEDENHDLVPTKEFHFGEDSHMCKRYESQNIFVTNNNNGEEYLFTLGTSTSYTELHDLDKDKVIFKPTGDFLYDPIFSFRFPLLNITNSAGQKEYIVCSLRESDHKYKVKKFSFSSFSLDNNNMQTNSDQYALSFNHRVSSGFIMNDWIVVFFIDWEKKYALDIYDYNLNWLNKNSIPTLDQLNYNFEGDSEKPGVFSKSCYLKDNYAFFIYYLSDAGNSLKFKLLQLTGVSSYTKKISQTFSDYNLDPEIRMNELVRINEERLAFIAMPINNKKMIYIFLIDFFDNYNNAKIREYSNNLDNKYELQLEFAGDVYNGHLIFTSTTKDIHSSILMIFGYANATNEIIDISNYFAEVDINNENSIFEFLRDRTPIENNIFGYEKLEYPVILVRIPPEMLFYNKSTGTEVLLSSGDVIHSNSILKQNYNIRKQNKLYSMDYRLRVREREYDIFDTYPNRIIKNPSNCEQR